MRKKYRTTSTFIQDSQKVHGIGTFLYPNTVFKDVHTKVSIFCKVHNSEFSVSPNKHLRGQGCQLCAYEKRSKSKLKDIHYFISRAKEKHGNLYDYTNSVYVRASALIDIKCNTCEANFRQVASAHLNGAGCSVCAHDRGMDLQRHTTETFIQAALKVHSDNYLYKHTKYGRNNREKVLVTCAHCHVTSRVIPSNFLSGATPVCDCPHHYGYREDQPGYVYYLSINNGEAYKIGITNRTVEQRFCKQDLLKIGIIKIWKFQDGKKARNFETKILQFFKKYKYRGPNLLKTGNSELFKVDILTLDQTFFSQTDIFN